MKRIPPVAAITLAHAGFRRMGKGDGGNPDMEQSARNVYDSHIPHQTGDSHVPEKGEGNSYGSALLDGDRK